MDETGPDTTGEANTPTDGVLASIKQRLDDRLVAVYRFGSGFAKGPKAPSARLLVLVHTIDGALLDDMRNLVTTAREAGVGLRLDTPASVLSSADVLPIFTLELQISLTENSSRAV